MREAVVVFVYADVPFVIALPINTTSTAAKLFLISVRKIFRDKSSMLTRLSQQIPLPSSLRSSMII